VPLVANPVTKVARRHVGLLVTAMAGAVLVVVLTLGFSKGKSVYALSVDEALARPRSEEPVRIQGVLRRGSLCRVIEPCEYRLELESRYRTDSGPARALSVVYPKCVVPDTLGYETPGTDLEIVAEGNLTGDGRLVADRLIIMCPAVYRMRDGSAPARSRHIPECH
jgi:cytochrome c-type biogenesis protein CcmE